RANRFNGRVGDGFASTPTITTHYYAPIGMSPDPVRTCHINMKVVPITNFIRRMFPTHDLGIPREKIRTSEPIDATLPPQYQPSRASRPPGDSANHPHTPSRIRLQASYIKYCRAS